MKHELFTIHHLPSKFIFMNYNKATFIVHLYKNSFLISHLFPPHHLHSVYVFYPTQFLPCK